MYHCINSVLLYIHYYFSTYKRVVNVKYCKYISASTIQFTPANASFVAGLPSQELELTCGLEDSESKDIKRVVSIVINKMSGEKVASISDYAPARAADDQVNVRVVGDVSGTSGKLR